MSPPTTVTQIRYDNIRGCLDASVATLDILAETFKTPFLGPISNTTRSLLTAVETVRQNKADCIQLMERTYQLLNAIVVLHIRSETGGDFPPIILNHIGKFTKTLHKIHTYVEAQQDKSRIKQFFRQGEMTTLLKACNMGLQDAIIFFKVQNINLLEGVAVMRNYAEEKHREVLDLIDAVSSDKASTITSVFAGSYNSTNSISMLPSEPKIFHGRETEVTAMLETFTQTAPRIAILGPGGMGKTSLGRAILHHPQITAAYTQHRFFVPCETASSAIDLAGLIGAHLGLKVEKNSTRSVVQYLSSNSPCLLVLDNLETVWEPIQNRGEVEEFLSLLTDVERLALIITMRGAERPAKVSWSRPFLPSLQPLSQEAAHQTFADIADDGHDPAEVDQVLLLTDNMPLAIDLIAHLVDSEGCYSVLTRWEEGSTSVISEGHDKRSNLELSISLSLTSPRVKSLPQSQDLLSLLSMLPDGLSDLELQQSNLPIEDILSCKALLVRTSLAYIDDQKRLKALVPIREYLLKSYPPTAAFVQPLRKHFQGLLGFYHQYEGTLSSARIIARLSSNFMNIHNLLQNGLDQSNPELANTIYSICYLQNFGLDTGCEKSSLLNGIFKFLPRPIDHALELYVVAQVLNSWRFHAVPHPDRLVKEALGHLPYFNDSARKCVFYNILGNYYQEHDNNVPAAIESFQTALTLAIKSQNTKSQSQALTNLAWTKWRLGDHSGAQIHAYNAQRLAKISADLWTEAYALRMEAMCWCAPGNYQHALSLCNRARGLLDLCGISGGNLDLAIINAQAEIHKLKSEYMHARTIHVEILGKAVIEQDPNQHASALLNIAEIDGMTGRTENVQTAVEKAKSIFNRIQYTVAETMCDTIMADLYLTEKKLLAAKTLLQKCLSLAWEYTEIMTFCLERFANGDRWMITDWPSSWAIIYLAHALKSKQNLDIHKALQFIGNSFVGESDQCTAKSLFTVALEGFTQMDVHRSRAECMLHLAEISKDNGDLLEATQLWLTARSLFERSSQAKQIVSLNKRLETIPAIMLEEHNRSVTQLTSASLLEAAGEPTI